MFLFSLSKCLQQCLQHFKDLTESFCIHCSLLRQRKQVICSPWVKITPVLFWKFLSYFLNRCSQEKLKNNHPSIRAGYLLCCLVTLVRYICPAHVSFSPCLLLSCSLVEEGSLCNQRPITSRWGTSRPSCAAQDLLKALSSALRWHSPKPQGLSGLPGGLFTVMSFSHTSIQEKEDPVLWQIVWVVVGLFNLCLNTLVYPKFLCSSNEKCILRAWFAS